MYIHRSGTHTRAVCSSCSTTWKVSDPPNRESLGFQVWVYLRICIHLCTYLSTILILHYTFREHLLTLDNLVFAISKSGFWYIPRVPPVNIHQKRKERFQALFWTTSGVPPTMRSSPNCSHSVIPPLASRFRKKHGVSRRPSLRWLQCLVPSMETRRMVQPPIPGVCTSQGPSRQRKHTAVTVARLSQRKTFELSLRILAEWFLNRSGYCCEIHYTKVLMHRK